MKISVIVPLYRGKQYIPQILKMMERNRNGQKTEYELEVIFVNDCMEEEIRETDVENPNLTTRLLINERNMGIHGSRVAGLEAATGEYVMFFDQDDRISDHYFASQIQILKKTRAAVVVANGIAQGAEADKLLYRYWFMQWTVRHMWFYTRFDCRIISPGQCLVRRDAIPKIWTEEILTRNGADDFYLWLALLSKGEKFCINRRKVYTHVYTSNNTSLDNVEMRSSVQQFLDIDARYGIIPRKHHLMIQERINGKEKFAGLVGWIEQMNKK